MRLETVAERCLDTATSKEDGAPAHSTSTPQRNSPIDCEVDTTPPSPDSSQKRGGGQHQRGEKSKRRLFLTEK